MRLDVIIRTSKRKADARSPQQQRDICERCSEANGYEIVAVHDSGADESGKTMARPSIERTLERIRSGETDGLMVAFLDRIGRAPIEEAMAVVREIHALGGALVPADAGGLPIRPDDPQAETNLVIQLQIARQYWLQTANRFKGSQADAIKAGKHIGYAPIGYVKAPDGTLAVDPSTAPLITEAFRRAAVDGHTAALSYLRAELPGQTPKGRDQWDSVTVRRLLARRVYLGEIVHKTAGSKLDAHEALTDLATFTAAQTQPRHRATNGDYPLSNVAVCCCGSGLVGQLQHVNGKTARRYRCGTARTTGHSSIKADNLESYLRETIRAKLGDTRIRIGSGAEGLTEADTALRSAKAEVERYASDTEMREILGDDAWRAGAKARSEAVKAAQAAYEAAAKSAVTRELPTAAELDSDEGFSLAVRGMVESVTVDTGRGLSVEQRAGILWQ